MKVRYIKQIKLHSRDLLSKQHLDLNLQNKYFFDFGYLFVGFGFFKNSRRFFIVSK
jgi:hypothetical protein